MPTDGVDEKVRLRLAGGAEGQLLVRPVQRVAGLEGDDPPPAELAEVGAQLVRGVAAAAEVVVHRLLDAGDRPAEIDRPRPVDEEVDRRMRGVLGAEDAARLRQPVGGPEVGDRHDRQDDALLVAERDVLPGLDLLGEGLAHVERDRHRPERAVGEAHLLDDAVVVGLGEKALQRVEAAVHQELEVAGLAGREVPGRKLGRLELELRRAVGGDVELGDRHEIAGGHVLGTLKKLIRHAGGGNSRVARGQSARGR